MKTHVPPTTKSAEHYLFDLGRFQNKVITVDELKKYDAAELIFGMYTNCL